MNPPQVIAIDGPAASGKSSVAREVARRLGWIFVNTGQMYRTATWAALRDGLNPADQNAVAARCDSWQISCIVSGGRSIVQMDGHNIESELSSPAVNQSVSLISLIPAVRDKLVEIQRGLGRSYPVVMEGRDIGTYVFPGASVKFYIDASEKVRSRRRGLQGLTDVVGERDRIDSTRAMAPLKAAVDAVVIDSSNLDFPQVISRVMDELARRGLTAAVASPSAS